jgi:hypothetical protein
VGTNLKKLVELLVERPASAGVVSGLESPTSALCRASSIPLRGGRWRGGRLRGGDRASGEAGDSPTLRR